MEQPPLQQTQDTGWCDFFSTFHNPYNGFVESKEQLEELKWHYEVETKSYFVSVKTSSTFGNTDKYKCLYIFWMILLKSTIADAGQQCLSCSNIETVLECHHNIVCDNTEVCYTHKYITESGGTSYDLGCAQPETCNHLIGSIFGRRSEGHHLTCSACCNNTRLCNQDISCSNIKPNGTKLPRECSDINLQNPPDGVYTIYPDGRQGVPVYCDMMTNHARWTVIQRRINGFVDFYRGWSAYKEGFGNASGEYWLGNDNIHEITSHRNHDLRIELTDFDGNMRYAEYSIFTVADEENGYRLLVYNYSGNAGNHIYRCLYVFGMLLIQLMLSDGGQECLSCSNIETVQDCQHYIVCDNTEVCYKQRFATESGGTSYDFGCSQSKTCNHLIGSIFGKRAEGHHIICSGCCNNTRLCNQDITCLNIKPNNTRVPQECADIKNKTDGVYTIYPDGQRVTPVYCDMTTKNLSWTVIQRRINGFVDFYRGWSAYKDGFGDVNGEYWLGNDNIHEITSHGNHDLRIELQDFDGNTTYAEYSIFNIADEGNDYRLLVYNYSGNAGDSLTHHNGMRFSTFDKDNDQSGSNCAASFKGAWWYRDCHFSNLNGKYLAGFHPSSADGINWYHWRGHHYSLKSTKMMIRKY